MLMLRKALLYFDQAVRDGSIRKAADNLHIASSAIDRQLLQLESDMGVELFVRLPRGIRPTAAGEALLGYVRRWNREASVLAQEVGRLKGGMRGTLRIAAAESLTHDAIPRAMTRLQEKFPLVDFKLISGDNYKVKAELLARDADVVCAFDTTDTGPTTTVATLTTPIGVVCTPDHPLALADVVALSDCVKYPVIAPDEQWLAHSSLRELFAGDRVPLRIVVRAERIGILTSIVQAGVGFTFLSRVGLTRDIAEGRLVWRPLAPGTIKPASISVLVPRGRVQPLYVTAFLDLLREELEHYAQ